MKMVRGIHRVVPLPPRERGRVRMERGFKHAIEHMRLSGAMTPGFVMENEIAVMRMHLDDIDSIIEETIADDARAGLLMRSIGYALDCASGLGRIEGDHPPASELRARREKRRVPGLITGAENKADAEERHTALKSLWVKERGLGRNELARKIVDGDFGFVTDLSEERIRSLFTEWKRAGL
jgi:hypothetical protein